jgi:hypothetical protein
VGTARPVTEPDTHARGLAIRWARSLSGMLASGTVVLAAGLFAVWGVAAAIGDPGPGAVALAGHTAGAAAAVALNRVGRRRTGLPGAAALLGVPIVLLLLGWLFWWG